MSLKEKIRILKDKIDINRKFPNYATKNIFRVGVGVLFLFVIMVIYIHGFNAQWTNIECDSYLPCPNPFVVCNDPDVFPTPAYCEFYNSIDCNGKGCDLDFIEGGDYIGEKPPKYIEYANLIMILILGITFLINHIVYVRRKK